MADEDWNDLGAVWQEKEETDISSLTKDVRKKTKRMYVLFTTEMLICLFGALFGAYWMVNETHEFEVGLVFFLFSIGGGYFAWWARRGAWRAPEGSALDELKFAKKRAQAGVRYARVNLWGSPVALAMTSFILWQRYDGGNISEEGFTRLLIAAGTLAVFLPVCAIWSFWYKGKKSAEVEQLHKVITEMEDE